MPNIKREKLYVLSCNKRLNKSELNMMKIKVTQLDAKKRLNKKKKKIRF